MPEDHILLPCYGDPLREVWLPRTDNFDILKIPSQATTKTAGQVASEKARSLGFRDPVVRGFGREQIGGVWVYVWVAWLKPSDKTTKLRRMSVDNAAKHSKFGSMVRHLKWHLANR